MCQFLPVACCYLNLLFLLWHHTCGLWDYWTRGWGYCRYSFTPYSFCIMNALRLLLWMYISWLIWVLSPADVAGTFYLACLLKALFMRVCDFIKMHWSLLPILDWWIVAWELLKKYKIPQRFLVPLKWFTQFHCCHTFIETCRLYLIGDWSSIWFNSSIVSIVIDSVTSLCHWLDLHNNDSWRSTGACELFVSSRDFQKSWFAVFVSPQIWKIP